jgi:hypothetical protein
VTATTGAIGTDNIIHMPEPLEQIGRRIDEAYEQTQRGRQQWIEGTLKLASALADARDHFPSNNAFGVWIAENGHNHIGDHDRAALINMASPIAIDITRIVLHDTMRTSWRLIWEQEIEPRLGSAAKTPEILQPAEIPQNVAPIASLRQTATPLPGRTSLGVTKRSPFYGLERATQVFAVYQVPNTRVYIGKVVRRNNGKDLWAMILTAIDVGFLTETDYVASTQVSLRILFPDERAKNYCRDIDLSTPQAIKRVRDFILPAMIENKDAILANPSQIGSIINRAQYEAQVKVNEAAATVRLAERRAAMPTNQYEVVMYGEVFWPNPKPEITSYSYDQCRAACWYFYETDQLYKVTTGGGDSAKGRAMMMRFSTRWFTEYADREMEGEQRDKIKKVFQLVHAMSFAMEQNPTAVSKRPPFPTNDGEWP